ncbi:MULTISPECIES: hypothetical protein [Streptomyces]|jgi:hypothetical protein|uniref:Uncharacterized protein n=2 Tax=Streptomyces TaxID=1883 RepID=A0ABZ1K2X4_9ACTN|nr:MULTISPECIES: hypothetical protein [Streptomyces]TPN30560.1 hypothetical protein FKO01_17340 [Mesorhizobium sp. B2-3-3]WSQ79042.1 hypothetical protein OG725_18900 [Streptomyces sp. NBC_01213]AGJ55793.1 hypothetical protein F750_3325 [Streptomyces sp. PAMC 26508]MCX4414212.1 hypothetical protein [[Kitasatospora] papulosa]MCY1652313.1 hypothetical protein [Streptomyces sp. SL203]
MGWTRDFNDAARNRRSTAPAGPSIHEGGGSLSRVHDVSDFHELRLGIPRILHRRARWVSARLRHPRG